MRKTLQAYNFKYYWVGVEKCEEKFQNKNYWEKLFKARQIEETQDLEICLYPIEHQIKMNHRLHPILSK